MERSISYCKKDDTRLDGPNDYGRLPNGYRAGRDYVGALELAKKGEFLRAEADILVPYLHNLQKLSVLFAEPKEPKGLRGLWYYGPSGTGKSRTAF